MFYRLRSNSAYNPEFTWAAVILSESAIAPRVCPACGSVRSYPTGPLDVAVEDGTRYPDVLGCGAYPLLIVSERVIASWEAAAVGRFHTYPVRIAEVRSDDLGRVPPPRYVWVEIDGRCQVDLPASGAEAVRYCPRCHHLETRPDSLPGFKMVPGSWDGAGLFRDAALYPCVSFCTEVVLQVACRERLTNFNFVPMDKADRSSRGLDYWSMCR